VKRTKRLLILLLVVFVLFSLLVACSCYQRTFSSDLKITRHELVDCTVYGTVTNLGRITAQDVKVYAEFTDGSGAPVGSKLSYSIGELHWKESADFWITAPQQQCDAIVGYQVWPECSE